MPSTQFLTVDLRILGCGLCDLEVESLGNDLYRIAEIPFGLFTPFPIELEYHDIVEIVSGPDGTLELRCVRERGGWRRFGYVVSFEYAGSEAFEEWISKVEANGGTWIREAGGLVTIVLPPDSILDPGEVDAGPR